MVIDYHIHLEKDIYFERCPYDLQNIQAYLHMAEERGIHELGITEHCNRFLEFGPIMKDLAKGPYPDLSRWFQDMCTESMDRYVAYIMDLKEKGYPIKLGIEVEFVPERIEETNKILEPYPWDFILGSVHMLGKWAIDFSADVGWPERDVNQVYIEYIDTVIEAARSGLFDVIAHLDLVKKYGHRPKGDLSSSWLKCLDVIAQEDLAIEVSTAGLRKKVKEIYPSRWLLTKANERGIPITLSSDAHDASDVGADVEEAIRLALECGYREVCTFHRRKGYPQLLRVKKDF